MSASPADFAIRVFEVTKHYGSFTAVDHFSFDVRCGEIFSLLGPNGAGKTTTIRMILDILRPDSGRIEVLGGPISDATKNRIGYLPEERGLYRNVPVIEVLVYLAQLKGMSRRDAQARGLELLARMDLAEHAKSKVSELSKGMQQKVQIAATVIHRPDLIIIDEPFAGLDPVNTQLIKDLLFEMNRQGVTIVMSTHQMQQVEQMANRLVMINEGRRVLYGGVDEVRQRFADNAVLVEGEGDWAALAGVRQVTAGQSAREAVLHLADGVTPDDVMGALAASDAYHIRKFELAVPSLNEIFIQVAGNRHNGGNGGEHGMG